MSLALAKYVCTLQVLKKFNTFLVIVSAWNLRSFMHFSTCDVCLYIASAKKNLTPCWDEPSFND